MKVGLNIWPALCQPYARICTWSPLIGAAERAPVVRRARPRADRPVSGQSRGLISRQAWLKAALSTRVWLSWPRAAGTPFADPGAPVGGAMTPPTAALRSTSA